MKDKFIPASRYAPLLMFYDGFVRRFFKKTFNRIIEAISPQPNQKVLDVGCGPGNIILKLKQYEPSLDVTGLDIDPKILSVAKKKLKKYNIEAQLVEASATDFAIEEDFDIIVSTLMFHHIDRTQKQKMLSEVMNHLRENGRFFLYDFGPPTSIWGKILVSIWLPFEPLIKEGTNGEYRKLLEDTGFKNVKSHFRSLTFELFEAEK